MSVTIILPNRRANPTRAREILPARPSDIPFWREAAERGLKPIGGGGNQTNQWIEPIFNLAQDGPQVVSVAVETALLNATTSQPWFYGGFFGGKFAAGKIVDIEATGVLQTTGTPTYTFLVRLGSTQNVITGAIVAQTAGLVMVSGAAGAGTYWELRCRLQLNTPGIGTGNATITSSGIILCSGFPSPFFAQMEVSTPPSATWTNTLDGSLSQYLMLSMNPGTSSASNNCTLKTLRVWATTL